MGILLKCFGGSSSSTSTEQPEHLCPRFSLAQLRKSTDNFDKSQKIGTGPYGSITYRGCISIKGQLKDFVVKRIEHQSRISPEAISMYNDILFMCQLHHPNLVSLVGFCDNHNEMIVVYDYARNGSVHRQLFRTERKPRPLSWKKRLEISTRVARRLHYLHSGTKRAIIYCSLTSTNILLDENWVPKLNFFGFSLKGPKFSEKDVKPKELETIAGGLGYMAPENFSPAPNVTYKCDVYSFGVVLLELICGKTLSQIMSRQHELIHVYHREGRRLVDNANVFSFTLSVVKKVRDLAETGNADPEIVGDTLRGQIAPQCWKLYMDIIESCLSEDPSDRPNMGEVEVQLEELLQLELSKRATLAHGLGPKSPHLKQPT